MSKYKLKDKKTGKDMGVLHVDFSKLANEIKPRIVAGVCFTLMIGSTLGVVGEVMQGAQAVYEEAKAQEIVETMHENMMLGVDPLIAHLKIENTGSEEIDARIDYLDEQFEELSKDEEIMSNEQFVALMEDFQTITTPKNINDGVADEYNYQYSDMVMVRDKLREICESVKDILEVINKNKDNAKGNGGNDHPYVPKDDKRTFPYGDSPRDIYYKEPLNDPPQVFNPGIGRR